MAKFKVQSGKKDDGAKQGAEPPAEPHKPKERKSVHPGLDLGSRCRKCGKYLVFHGVSVPDVYVPLSSPFGRMQFSFCECGIWTRDERDRIRWIRYSSGTVEIGGGEVYAP